MHKKSVVYTIIIGILLASLGCSFSGFNFKRVSVGDMIYDSEVVELGKAEDVRVNVQMGAGELKIDSGAASLMEADFTYNIDSWAPEVSYTDEESKGRLTIRQPQNSDIAFEGNVKYEWDLRFTSDIPLDMRIECGAGDHDLDLARLNLTALDVKLGAGDVKINLTDNPELDDIDFDIGAGNVDIDMNGTWEKDVIVDVKGGVGQISLRLPKDVGVRVDISQGIGKVDTSGLTRQGDSYVNAAYGESDVVMDINIQAGVGQINVTVVP